MTFKLRRLVLVYLLSRTGISPSLALAENTDLGYRQGSTSIAANLQMGYKSSQVQESSFYYQPSFSFLAGVKRDTYGLQGRYGYSLFSPERKKDLAQRQLLKVNSYWSPTPSNSFSLATAIQKEDEQRGTGLTSDDLNNNELDSFRYSSVTGGYDFSRSSQKSMIFSLGYALDKKTYDSNRDLALNANLEQNKLVVSLGYKWSEEKKIYLESTRIQQEYPSVIDNSKDSENTIASLGVTWPLTSISDISVAYGKENKEFNIGNESFTTNYWLGILNWSPISHTKLSLESVNTQNPISKINQTLNESKELALKWFYIKNSYHNITASVKRSIKKEIINNILKKERDILLSIKNSYHDFDLEFIWKRRYIISFEKTSEVSISLDYNFKGEL